MGLPHEPSVPYAGIDGASRPHAVGVVDDHGGICARFQVANTGKGLGGPIRRPVKLGVAAVAIECRVLGALPRTPKDLQKARLARCNQLTAQLERCFPGAVGLFAELHSATATAFLGRSPTSQAATGRAVWVAAPLDAIAACHSREPEPEAEIIEPLEAHPDQAVFTSLAKAGRGVRAAARSSEIGHVRTRFPDEEALAGVAPVTRASGKCRSVGFRWACDKKLRPAVVDSRHASPWAAKVSTDAPARTHRHPQAVRILARAWIRVSWPIWQAHTSHDPAKHAGAVRHLATQA